MFFGEGSSNESKWNPVLGKETSAMGVLQKKHLEQDECSKATLWLSQRAGSRFGILLNSKVSYSCNHSGVTSQTRAPPPLHGSSATLI